jgi:hypothetical protein
MNDNYKVQWYAHIKQGGVRFIFDNGYAVSIIPAPNPDMVEIAIIHPDGRSFVERDGDDIMYISPDELSAFFASVQSYPKIGKMTHNPLVDDQATQNTP